jgi:hypothetical protein
MLLPRPFQARRGTFLSRILLTFIVVVSGSVKCVFLYPQIALYLELRSTLGATSTSVSANGHCR